MRWVVLGHAGFLGRHVVRAVERRREEVHGFGRATLDLRRPDALSSLDRLAGPDAILVFASGLTPEHCREVDGLSDNLAMAVNVAKYLAVRPFGRAAYVSSDAVYPFVDGPVTEETPTEADNPYALSKYVSERVLQIACKAKGIPLLIARPAGIYGIGDTHNSYGPNRFIRSIAAERVLRLFGEGEETRDHIHVEDAAELIVRLAPGAAGIFNLVTGRSVRFADVAAMLKEVSSVAFKVENGPRKGPITHRAYDASRLSAACPDFRFKDMCEALRAQLEAALSEAKS